MQMILITITLIVIITWIIIIQFLSAYLTRVALKLELDNTVKIILQLRIVICELVWEFVLLF